MCILRTKIRYNLNLKIKISLQLMYTTAINILLVLRRGFFIFVLFYIVNLGIALHTKQFTEETIKEKDSVDSSVVNGSSITRKQLKDNSMKLEETTLKELIEKYKKTTKTQRSESIIYFAYITPAVLLFWISAIRRINPVAGMWPCTI